VSVAITRALGGLLEGVIECVHVFDGRPRGTSLALWLRFDGSRWLHVSASADGESLSIDDQEPGDVGYSMDELGQIEFRDNTQTKRFQRWVGQRCEAAWTVTFNPSPAIAGLRLQLGSGDALVILNWGDDLYVHAHYPAGSGPVETPVVR